MKAVVFKKYGSPDVLRLAEVAKPIPRDNEVLLRVHAVSVNDWDWALLRGQPLVNRLLFGLFRPKRQVLGSDIAGRVESIGAKVTRFRPGDEVYGDLSGRWGGFAEYMCAPESALSPKPENMDFAQAAAMPQAGLLALQGLRHKGQIKPGQKVLINGAGGGTGTFAIQIAKSLGARVWGVDRPEKLETMRAAGAAEVIDYTRQDFTKSGQQFDFILDVAAHHSIFDCRRVLAPGGSYVMVGGASGRIIETMLLGPLISLAGSRKMGILAHKPNEGLADLAALFEAGMVVPLIDRYFPLDEAAEAMRYFGTGLTRGKVVVKVV